MDAEVVGKKAITARASEASTNNIQSTFSGLLQSPIKPAAIPVSYTHLTLPTSDLV